MSKLGKLRSRGKNITLTSGEMITILPATIDLEAEVAMLQEEGKIMDAISHLIKSTLKIADPEATDDEINNIDKKDLKILTEEILIINGFQNEKKKSNEN